MAASFSSLQVGAFWAGLYVCTQLWISTVINSCFIEVRLTDVKCCALRNNSIRTSCIDSAPGRSCLRTSAHAGVLTVNPDRRQDATASRSGSIRVLRDGSARHHDGKSRMESGIRCKAAVGAELVQGTEDDRRDVETPRLAILEILLRRWRCLQDAVSRYRGRV